MKKTRTILVIDDNRVDLFVLKSHLEKMAVTVLTAKRGQTGINMAIDKEPDLILLDIMIPDMDGFEVCKQLKANSLTSGIPVIFVSAREQLGDKIEGLNLGAIDYVTKPYDAGELRTRIESVFRILELEEKLLALAVTDDLTGLPNRRGFFDALEREMFNASLSCKSLALMIIDVDHFKEINDAYGYIEGDKVLIQIGKTIKENISAPNIAARYGGEEFAILMPDTLYAGNPVQMAEELRSAIEQSKWKIGRKNISITVSIGLAYAHSCDSLKLIGNADRALYTAKKHRGNCIVTRESGYANEEYTHKYKQLQSSVSLMTDDLRKQFLEITSAFLKAMASKDPYVISHAENSRDYAAVIAEQMEVPSELKEHLESAALLHDLGGVAIPDEILQKTESLDVSDRAIIEQHPVVTVEILKTVGIFDCELPIIRQHHERFDGDGYPDGLSGKEICIGARILALADCFDALTSPRPYHLAVSCEKALEEIAVRSGSQFDPEVFEAFKRAYAQHKEKWPLCNFACSEDLNSVPLTLSNEG